jgi:hypothetical protein
VKHSGAVELAYIEKRVGSRRFRSGKGGIKNYVRKCVVNMLDSEC